jgi:hypothetical protein
VGALRRQTLPAANLGRDESRFGGREPARRSLLRLDAGRTTADDIRLAGRLVLALVRPCQVEFPYFGHEREAESFMLGRTDKLKSTQQSGEPRWPRKT